MLKKTEQEKAEANIRFKELERQRQEELKSIQEKLEQEQKKQEEKKKQKELKKQEKERQEANIDREGFDKSTYEYINAIFKTFSLASQYSVFGFWGHSTQQVVARLNFKKMIISRTTTCL